MDSWDYKWFGFWAEDGDAYSLCPSVHAYRNKGEYENSERVLEYLSSGNFVCAANFKFSCHLCDHHFDESKSIHSDGEWIWTSDLIHYIDKHKIWIPESFLLLMDRRAYQCPSLDTISPMGLEWPPKS